MIIDNDADSYAAEDPVSLAELYHENSKQRRYDREFGHRIDSINRNPEFHRIFSQAYKTYAGASLTPLPAVQPNDGPAFEHVIMERRSLRHFTGELLTQDEIARLLAFGNGITGQLTPADPEHGVIQSVRAAPSGGALYPVELYITLPVGAWIEPGVYHYAVAKHALELLCRGDVTRSLANATSYADLFTKAGMTVFLTVMLGRAKFKYGERGYRFALLEAGHIAQNILLTATALKLGAVAVGGFIDDEINTLLGIDGVDEFCIYLAAIGRPVISLDEQLLNAQVMVDDLLSMLWMPGDISHDGTDVDRTTGANDSYSQFKDKEGNQ